MWLQLNILEELICLHERHILQDGLFCQVPPHGVLKKIIASSS